jgi:hypothetical protein
MNPIRLTSVRDLESNSNHETKAETKDLVDKEFLSSDFAMRGSLLSLQKLQRQDQMRSQLEPKRKMNDPSSTIDYHANLTSSSTVFALLIFILLLPLYCIFQLFLALRNQILIILWRYTSINNALGVVVDLLIESQIDLCGK